MLCHPIMCGSHGGALIATPSGPNLASPIGTRATPFASEWLAPLGQQFRWCHSIRNRIWDTPLDQYQGYALRGRISGPVGAAVKVA